MNALKILNSFMNLDVLNFAPLMPFTKFAMGIPLVRVDLHEHVRRNKTR